MSDEIDAVLLFLDTDTGRKLSEALEELVSRAREAEREACAELCDEVARVARLGVNLGPIEASGAEKCAERIRARGSDEP